MIYIVTPCSRPENLDKIYKSIFEKMPVYDKKHYAWVIIFDLSIGYDNYPEFTYKYDMPQVITMLSKHTNAFVGHKHRNFWLNSFLGFASNSSEFYKPLKKTSWLYFLDDDTLLHPNFHSNFFPHRNSNKTAIIFDQNNPNGTIRLHADINKVKVNHIDMGQYIVNLSKIPRDLRFKEDKYEADGIFIEELFKLVGPNEFEVIPQVMSTYNQLRP